jgi:ribosome biogenesis protein Tsr3
MKNESKDERSTRKFEKRNFFKIYRGKDEIPVSMIEKKYENFCEELSRRDAREIYVKKGVEIVDIFWCGRSITPEILREHKNK